MIKHISFDFWDTLYVGNPNFRLKRAEYLQKKYGVTKHNVQFAVNKTKELCDGLGEKTMCCVNSITQCWHLLDCFGEASLENAEDLNIETHIIFVENPPKPVFTEKDLVDLKNKGVSLSISCNTGLISGESIAYMLKKTDIYDLFDFTLFSDRIKYFKPSPFFMKATIDEKYCAANTYDQILHIGDNDDTDGYMCQLTGVNYLKVGKGRLNFDEINNYL